MISNPTFLTGGNKLKRLPFRLFNLTNILLKSLGDENILAPQFVDLHVFYCDVLEVALKLLALDRPYARAVSTPFIRRPQIMTTDMILSTRYHFVIQKRQYHTMYKTAYESDKRQLQSLKKSAGSASQSALRRERSHAVDTLLEVCSYFQLNVVV